MGEFIDAALGFPAVLFSFLLVVVIAYWLMASLGGLDIDILDGDVEIDTDGDVGAFTGLLSSLGLRGVPATVILSLLITVSWFVSVTGTLLLSDVPGWRVLSVGVLLAALICAWFGTRVMVVSMRRIFPADGDSPRRADFVGSVCVIRTGTVRADFGQAEVTSPDGSSAIVQVRQPAGEEPLTAGDSALIFEYNADDESFLVMPYDSDLGPTHKGIPQ